MSSSEKIPLGIPTTIGQADSSSLENLADRFPEHTYLSGHPRLKRPSGSFEQSDVEDLITIVQPVHELINQYFLDAYGYVPREIVTDFDTRTVQPMTAQRGGEWHRDQPKASSTALVSNALTTEYLVGNHLDARETAYWSRRIPQSPTNAKPKTSVNREAIADGLQTRRLKIYRPPALDVVLSDNYVHRSAPNIGAQAIEKTWLRLFIFDH